MDWQRLIPRYWLQNDPTCPVWNSVLEKALDQHGVESVGAHTCNVGPLRVWIANWPYGYGNSYGCDIPNTGLPSVRVRKKLRTAIRSALLAKVENWPPDHARIDARRGETQSGSMRSTKAGSGPKGAIQ